jgi:Tfp pilus assembly protein PilO
MTNRDRLVLIGLSALAVLAAAWLLVVSPERKKAASLKADVSAASAQLAAAEGKVTSARGDETRYTAAYASIVRLGKAVPAGEELPSLMYQLAQASERKNVDFASIVTGTSGSGSGSSASATPTPVSTAGFTQMPFTFVFNGSFDDLYHLFQQLNRYTTRTTSGGVQVSGRLLTIQSTKLAPSTSTNANGEAGKAQLTGTISATAYVLPAGQGLTGGATPTSPSGASATPASNAGAPASSPAAPAIARVTP